MNRVTPRVSINKNLYDLIGRTLNSNCFPTMKGRMIFIKEDRCYFEMLENENFADVTFVVGDTKVKAHKCILASRSNFFEKTVPASVTLMLLASGVNKLLAIADAQESPDKTWFGVV